MREARDLTTYQAGGVVPNRGPAPQDRVRGLVVEILAAKAPVPAFSDEDTLAEIGIASVDMVALLLAVESAFDVEVPAHEITADVFRSVSTIAALIGRLQPQAVAA